MIRLLTASDVRRTASDVRRIFAIPFGPLTHADHELVEMYRNDWSLV